MSTFDGQVKEFSGIRIDYFRAQPDKVPPAVCFLSHVHSDHIVGLDSLRSPFVYCTAMTKRLLLRMERYSHHVNFSRGILEARKQTYKHLKSVLRPLPLQTPVELELGPKNKIRVTLFDANHCPGACMFLVEGSGKSILYTGDIRAEPWWVNSLVRNPIMLPYTNGSKHLDCVYLDTTFASRAEIHKYFSTKAEGLTELLQKVEDCPVNSTFYFRAWTLGYEDVWLTLNSALASGVHVDPYHLRLFQDQSKSSATDEAAALGGFALGNGHHEGCLTTDSTARIHSCEPGLPCYANLSKNRNVVWITPIITRLSDGTEVAEVGAGGGGGDLYQSREVELDNGAILQGLRILAQKVIMRNGQDSKQLRDDLNSVENRNHKTINIDGLLHDVEKNEDVTLQDFLRVLNDHSSILTEQRCAPRQLYSTTNNQQRVIHFPFSRHSSYGELRDLLSRLKPKDVCPCVVEIQSWSEERSIESLFGDLCSAREFVYDAVNRGKHDKLSAEADADQETQTDVDTQLTETQPTQTQLEEEVFISAGNGRLEPNPVMELLDGADNHEQIEDTVAISPLEQAWLDTEFLASTNTRDGLLEELLQDMADPDDNNVSTQGRCLERRKQAFLAASACLYDNDSRTWIDLQPRCVRSRDTVELEL